MTRKISKGCKSSKGSEGSNGNEGNKGSEGIYEGNQDQPSTLSETPSLRLWHYRLHKPVADIKALKAKTTGMQIAAEDKICQQTGQHLNIIPSESFLELINCVIALIPIFEWKCIVEIKDHMGEFVKVVTTRPEFFGCSDFHKPKNQELDGRNEQKYEKAHLE